MSYWDNYCLFSMEYVNSPCLSISHTNCWGAPLGSDKFHKAAKQKMLLNQLLSKIKQITSQSVHILHLKLWLITDKTCLGNVLLSSSMKLTPDQNNNKQTVAGASL